MYRQNSYTFPLKETSIIWILSNTDNGQRTQNLGPWEKIYTNVTSLLRPLREPGVDNLWYVRPVGGYTNIEILSLYLEGSI